MLPSSKKSENLNLCLLCGIVAFLITGITLVGNSSEVKGQVEEGLKKYENPKYGLSFLYPSKWKEPFDSGCDDPTLVACGPMFTIFDINATKIEKNPVYMMLASVIELDKPSVNAKPCNCKTLKDFVAWDYIRNPNEGRTFINDNQTTIGNNFSAWQTETKYSDADSRHLTVYSLNGNVGYRFAYIAPSGDHFDKYLDGFKSMLKSVTIITPPPEKKPSFLNSNQIANLSDQPSADESQITDELPVTTATDSTGNSKDRMKEFIDKCIQDETNEKDIQTLKNIKSFVDAHMYARKYKNQSCGEEVQWFNEKQNNLRAHAEKLQNDINHIKNSLGLN